jgi:hypothetical protein
MDELPPHARRLLDAARTFDDPAPERRARADAALRDAFAARGLVDLPALSARSAAPAPHAAVRLSLAVKVALGLGATAVLAAGIWQLKAAQRRDDPPASQPSAASPRATEPLPLAPAPAGAAGSGAAPAPAPRAAPSGKSARAHKPNAGDDSALRSELRLVAAVDGMLRLGRYADALQMLGDAEQRARTSVLAEEHHALRVLALCGLGSAQAPQERAEFLRGAPRSMLAERVRAACVAAAPPLAP